MSSKDADFGMVQPLNYTALGILNLLSEVAMTIRAQNENICNRNPLAYEQ